MAVDKPVVQIIGPTPPPYHGVSVATRVLLDALSPANFSVVHLDTADRRGIAHVDQPDLWDVLLFIRQWFAHLATVVWRRPKISYLPLSQSRLGFVRDSLFMIPAFLSGSSVVAHLHGANFDQVYVQGGYAFKRYADFILKRVTKFVVLGEMLKPIFKEWADPASVAVIPNGIPESLPQGGMREDACTSSRFRIVFLSTLSRPKGLFVLLDAIALLARERLDFECHIAGPWWGAGTEEAAHAQVEASHLATHVTFHGPLTGDDKMRFLRSGDVFVFPGIQQEGQPLTVLEAMCAGLPVIATDRGCLRETVVEGVTGYIVPPNSPEAIAERLLLLLREPKRRLAFGADARLRYEREYTMPTFAARMVDLFAQLAQSNYHDTPNMMDSRD